MEHPTAPGGAYKIDQENYKCSLSLLMPRTFSSYLLPVFDIPVYHLERELDRVDVPVSGDIEMSIPEQICKRLHKGELFVKPVTKVVSSNALHSLLIVSIMLAEMI